MDLTASENDLAEPSHFIGGLTHTSSLQPGWVAVIAKLIQLRSDPNYSVKKLGYWPYHLLKSGSLPYPDAYWMQLEIQMKDGDPVNVYLTCWTNQVASMFEPIEDSLCQLIVLMENGVKMWQLGFFDKMDKAGSGDEYQLRLGAIKKNKKKDIMPCFQVGKGCVTTLGLHLKPYTELLTEDHLRLVGPSIKAIPWNKC